MGTKPAVCAHTYKSDTAPYRLSRKTEITPFVLWHKQTRQCPQSAGITI
jgi:hypothetical protein